MKNTFFFYTLVLLLTVGCSANDEQQLETDQITLDTADHVSEIDIPSSDNVSDLTVPPTLDSNKFDYQELYETGAIKIEGNYDAEDQRQGLWVSYYENGIKWSESFYSHGIKSGHSVTFFPNGKVRYIGEYKEDKQIGNWRFYDEEGNLVTEENY